MPPEQKKNKDVCLVTSQVYFGGSNLWAADMADGFVVKSSGCSATDKSSIPNTHVKDHKSVTPVPRNMLPSSGYCRNYTHKQAKHSYACKYVNKYLKRK